MGGSEAVRSFAQAAACAAASGDLQSAISHRRQALTHARTAFGEESPEFAAALHELGLSYYDASDADCATEWLLQGLFRAKRLGSQGQHLTAELHLALGNTHYANGNLDEAVMCFEDSRDAVEAGFRRESPHMAPVLLNQALVQLARRDNQAALGLLTRAHRLATSVLGVDGLDVACICHNTGVAHDRMDNFAEAAAWYRKALEIRERVLGKEDPHTGATYSNLAQA